MFKKDTKVVVVQSLVCTCIWTFFRLSFGSLAILLVFALIYRRGIALAPLNQTQHQRGNSGFKEVSFLTYGYSP